MPFPVTTSIYMRYITNDILKTLNGSNEGVMKISRMDLNGNLRSQDLIDFNQGVIQSAHYDERGHMYGQEWLDISRLPVLEEPMTTIEQVINHPVVSNNLSIEEEEEEEEQATATTQENNDDIDEIIDILTEIEQIQPPEQDAVDENTNDEIIVSKEQTNMSEKEMHRTEQRLENVVECAICIEKIDVVNNCVTPCGHKFCLKCILLACSRNASCPLCRSVLIPETTNANYEFHDVFGGSTRLDRTLEYDFAIRNWGTNENDGWGIGGPISER